MLILVYIAESIRLFIESIPILGLLVGAPIGIIILGFIATAIATFLERRLPSTAHPEPNFTQEPLK